MSKFLIEYTANLLGIDVHNPYALKDIGEIKHLESFVEFAKGNLKNTRLDYMNGLQKLNELKRMFELEINKGRLEKAQSASQELEGKVLTVKNMLRQEFTMGRNPHWINLQSDGKQLMTNYEISVLERIGSIHYVLRLSDDGVLQEAIEKQFRNRVLFKPKPQLVNQTLQKLVNKVRI